MAPGSQSSHHRLRTALSRMAAKDGLTIGRGAADNGPSCREAIEHAADALGGAERLAQWAAETPENETLFWTRIYPRLLPLGVNMLAVQREPVGMPRLRAKSEWLHYRLD